MSTQKKSSDAKTSAAKKPAAKKAAAKKTAEAPKKPAATRTTKATTKKAAPPAPHREANPNVLERGEIFFFYRPDVDENSPTGLADIMRFHLILRPESGGMFRVLTIGRKMLPEAHKEGQIHWGFVTRTFEAAEELRNYLGGEDYSTETQGERHLPSARPAGEGVYAIGRRGRDSVLAYALELPHTMGEVQQAFHIEPTGEFVISMKNPQAGTPNGTGLEEDRQVEFPEELQQRFGSRRWSPAIPVEFLNHVGAEFVLIGGRVDADEALGLDLDPQPEDEETSEVFGELHLEKSDRTIQPLFEGEWQ